MIRRQLFFFVLIGGTQLAADCLIFFLLVSVGVNVVLGNVVSRFSAACIGYILNSTITFRSQTKNHLQKSTALRYLSVWLTLTLTSSLLIILLQSAHREIILVVGKPLVEAALALASFAFMRYWIYGKPSMENRNHI